MSSGVALRSRGSRRPTTQKPSDFLGPAQSLSQTDKPGERKLNRQQIEAIQHLFRTHPAISAARSVLHGQLLSSGIVLKRDGETVELKVPFKNHLDEVWIPFAAEVIDSLLMFGYVVVVYDEDDDSLQKRRLKRLKMSKGQTSEDPKNFIPIVPSIDTYDISFVYTGKLGYKRKYLINSTAPGQASRVDEDARVIIRTHPDVSGNLNSPMAVVFDQGSFVSALTELALQAETTNSRPRLWAQMRNTKNNTALDPQALFFDSASRDVQSSQNVDENQQQVQALAMQQQLCSVINKLQSGPGTGPDIRNNSFNPDGGPSKSHVPPEVAPSLFVLPKEQEAMNAAGQMPQTRGDLEALSRLAIEQISAALGVPADLLFNGRFASKSTAQLSLLNTTVAQLAKTVNNVLTMAYRDIYGDEDGEDPAQLMLLTAPLSASDEIANLYTAGLIPIEVAMPAAMHAVGVGKDAIERVTREAKEREEKKKTCADCAEEAGKIGLELQNEKQKLDIEEKRNRIHASEEAGRQKTNGSDSEDGVELSERTGEE